MAEHPIRSLHKIARDLGELEHALHELSERLSPEHRKILMTVKSDLEALAARVDAVSAELPATIAAAVAAAEADLAADVTTLTDSITALEAAAKAPAGSGTPTGAVTVLPATLGPITTGQALSSAFTASDGSTGGTFAVTSGSFFSGVTLAADGTYSGTVTDLTGATVAFGVTVTSAAGVVSAPTEYSVTIG